MFFTSNQNKAVIEVNNSVDKSFFIGIDHSCVEHMDDGAGSTELFKVLWGQVSRDLLIPPCTFVPGEPPMGYGDIQTIKVWPSIGPTFYIGIPNPIKGGMDMDAFVEDFLERNFKFVEKWDLDTTPEDPAYRPTQAKAQEEDDAAPVIKFEHDGVGYAMTEQEIEAAYEYRKRQLRLLDAKRHLNTLFYGVEEEEIDPNDPDCPLDYQQASDFSIRYSVSYEQAVSEELLERYVKRYESRFDCAYGEDDLWEAAIVAVLEDYMDERTKVQTIVVDKQTADTINAFLAADSEDEYQGEDNTISITAKFDDGMEMDIKCCGCDDECSWTEAVLFENGSECGCTEPADDLLGPWEIECNGIIYRVNVEIAAE